MSSTWGLWDEEADSTVEADGRIVSTYVQTYLYKTTALTRPTPAAIAADMGILPGSPFAEDIHATAKKLAIKGGPEKTKPPWLAYLVTATFATNAPLPAENSTDPVTRRTIWSIRPTVQQRFVIRDRLDKLIVNTAGQPFDGGIPADVRLGTAIATRNVTAAGYDKDAVLANSGKLNSVTFLGGAPGTVQVDIETHEKYEGSYHFWEETYTFVYDPEKHQPKPVSAGFYQREAPLSGTLLRIQQDHKDVMEPEPLDANGILVPINSRPGSCVFVTVDFFDTMDFTSFGL